MEGTELLAGLREAARGAGIDLLGVTSAEPFDLREDWRHDQPRELLPTARSVVVAGFCAIYEPRLIASEPGVPRGRFPAFGVRIFDQMFRHCCDVVEAYLHTRGFEAVDAPDIAIKPAIVRSGLGRYGKHNVTITPELGSMAMYAAVVTDAPLADASTDRPLYEEACPADCTICLDACPTGALRPYAIDRSKCITNWEWGTFAPRELRHLEQDRLFGCGECIRACPLGRHVAARTEHPVATDTVDDSPQLVPLIDGDIEYYERSVPTFPKQAGVVAMRGSAIVAAANAGDAAAVESVGRALVADEPQLRVYAAWALGRLGTPRSRELVEAARETEDEVAVIEELDAALTR